MSDFSIGNAAASQLEAGLGYQSAALRIDVSAFLLFLMVALCPFQDTILQETPLKLVAASFSFVPLVCLFLLFVVRSWLQRPFAVSRQILLIIVYCSAVCAANLIWVDKGDAVINSRSLLPNSLLTILILFTVLGVNYSQTRWLRPAVYFGFFFTILGLVCGQVFGANAIPFLQETASLSGRPHGFSTEPSTLSVQIVAIGILTAHFLTRKWQKWIVGAATCILLVFSSSKGGLISLVLCAIVLPIVKSRASVLSKLAVAVLLIPFIYLSSLYIFSVFGTLIDANQTSTIATRFSMTVFALITVAHHPLGVGFTGFLPSIPRYLPQAMRLVQRLFPFSLAFVEVQEYLYPPQAQADCKTFFFDFLTFFGIPFAIVFFAFFGRLLRRLFQYHLYWLFVGVLFSALALMTYYSTIYAWTVPILIGVSLFEVKRIEGQLGEEPFSGGGQK